MNSTKVKNLEKWREEYLLLRRQIFCYDEDEDVFSLFRLNSKDLKYKGIIRRLQIEFNEDNFNRDLEKNEMLTQIQVIKREQGRVLKKMDENWNNPRMMNYLKGEAAKLIEKQNDFKNFHGSNFNYIEEEKDTLIQELNQFDIEAYADINYQQPQSRQKQNLSASPQQNEERKKLESDYQKKNKNKSKKRRKEFKSQEGLGDMKQSYDTSKKSSSDIDEDDTLLQQNLPPELRKKKQRQLSIEQDQNINDQEGDIDKDNDDRPTQADIFVTQDKIKKENPNQFLSKVSELPEEESRQMTQKLNSNILASNQSKGKSNFISPRSQNNKAAVEGILNHANSEFVEEDEANYYQEQDDETEHKYQQQQENNYFYSPQKKQNKQPNNQQYINSYNTPQTRKYSNSPNQVSQERSFENRQKNQRAINHQEHQYNQESRSYSPRGQSSKQNISLLDKSLNNISNVEEDQKDMQQIKEFVKRIDDLISDLGGSNCGWSEQDHRSFLYLMKKYGKNGLRTKEAMCDPNISVLQFYTDKQLLDHINSYNQYKLLMEQKQKYIDEYKEITQRIEKRKQAELQILKNVRKEREYSQLKQRIHSTVQKTEYYVKQFEEIKKKYKEIEVKSSQDYQNRQKQREKEVYDMVQRRQTQKEMLQAISSKKSQQEIKKVNMLKELSEKEKLQSLIPPQNQSQISSPQNLVHQEKIANIQKDLMMKMQQLEELRMQSKSKKINQYVYFTPQIKKKYYSPNRLKMEQIY